MGALKMKLFILFCAACTIVASTQCGIRQSKPHNVSSRYGRAVIGGNKVMLPGKYPWQVVMLIHDKEMCGGTVISEHWILTAAHCLEHQDVSQLMFRAGITDAHNENAAQHTVSDVIMHPEYIRPSLLHDIALVKLTSALEYDNYVTPICLPNAAQSIPNDGQAVVTGFGTANVRTTNKLVKDDQLRETIVPIIPLNVCEQRWKEYRPHAVTETWKRKQIVCASSYGHGSGKGDSGGPLVMPAADGRWFQIGIVSYGVPDDQLELDKYPSVYTDVRKYCDWIKQSTGGEASCQEGEVTLEDAKAE